MVQLDCNLIIKDEHLRLFEVEMAQIKRSALNIQQV